MTVPSANAKWLVLCKKKKNINYRRMTYLWSFGQKIASTMLTYFASLFNIEHLLANLFIMPADERFFNNEAISDKHTHTQQIYKQSPC